MIVYKIVNNLNGKIYVGKTTGPLKHRIICHRSENKYPVGRAINKYGIDAFSIAIIDRAETEDDLGEKEKYWIAILHSKSPNGYNLTDGGDGQLGHRHSEETKKIIREKRKLQVISESTKELLRQRWIGNQITLGHKHSEETKQKMREAHKGFKHTEEAREKIRANHANNKGKRLNNNFCPNGHEKTPENIILKGNARICKQCQYALNKRYREKSKVKT